MALPRSGLPSAIAFPRKRISKAKGNTLTSAPSHHLDPVVLQRRGADALAGRPVERVQHRRRGDADGGLADLAPETARGHDDRLDLRHLRDAHRVVVVEV